MSVGWPRNQFQWVATMPVKFRMQSKNVRLFLLVLSKCAQESNWVPKELDLAITYNKVIIPFQIDDEMLTKPFNFRLTNVQRIEAFHNLEQAYDQLLGRIGVQTGLTRMDFFSLDEQLVEMLPFALWYGKKYGTVITLSDGMTIIS